MKVPEPWNTRTVCVINQHIVICKYIYIYECIERVELSECHSLLLLSCNVSRLPLVTLWVFLIAECTTQNIAPPVEKLYEMISRYNNYSVFRCSVAFT